MLVGFSPGLYCESIVDGSTPRAALIHGLIAAGRTEVEPVPFGKVPIAHHKAPGLSGTLESSMIQWMGPRRVEHPRVDLSI